jgi:hypothetical protein
MRNRFYMGIAAALLAPLVSSALVATGADSRVDLMWDAVEGRTYHIYRRDRSNAPYTRINTNPHPVGIYSDFTGHNGRVYSYKVSEILGGGRERYVAEQPVSARTQKMKDPELVTSIQQAVFRYFWDYAHPVSGLTRERYHGSTDVCATGGTGFGLLAVMIGAERGFVTREAAAERVLKMASFLEKADRYHGAWAHWINGASGKTINFSRKDDGADIVETALLMQGLLTVRQYFDQDNAVEKALRETVTRLWESVEWDWFYRDGYMIWHWSPNYGFEKNLRVRGYNECMIVYLLAIASPTHAIPAKAYYEGWAGHDKYVSGEKHYGVTQAVGPHMGGPLFLSHYSFTCFDPRGKRDRFTDYFENARNITRIHRAYCRDNPGGFKGYNGLVWGLTACYTPDGYRACHPGRRDNGTIAPTAALGSMPFTPNESLASLKYFYHELGDRLWGPFGFYDAFNLDRNWFSDGYIAIDQGPIICMIENARTGLCWNNFMKNPEIEPMLDAIGWESED